MNEGINNCANEQVNKDKDDRMKRNEERNMPMSALVIIMNEAMKEFYERVNLRLVDFRGTSEMKHIGVAC